MSEREAEIGARLVRSYRLKYPQHAYQLLHIPNGAVLAGTAQQRSRQMASLKRQGLVVGASDYFLAVPGIDNSGLWLELKSERGKPSGAQLAFIKMMREAGYRAEWAAGYEAAWSVITDHMSGALYKNTISGMIAAK